jgi:Pre-PUA-like domain
MQVKLDVKTLLNIDSGESVLLYILGKNTVFFQLEKEQNFLPTVYTLWKHPEV